MPTTDRRGRGVLVGVGAVALALGGWALADGGNGPLPEPATCTARVDGHSVTLDPEQARHAALIAAVGVRRGLPARAVSIALATAYQESDIRNLDYGDRDSLGLFQQRPSQGWGSPEQVMDPQHATNRFYDALARVDGYGEMAITDAAQAVQRSAFGTAYADHEADARALASALTGYSPAAFSCVMPGQGVGAAAAVEKAVRKAFGELARVRRSGLAVEMAAPDSRRAWAVASYVVANADRLAVRRIVVDGKAWRAGEASERAWRPYDAGSSPDVVRVSLQPG